MSITKIALIQEMLESAEGSIRSAKLLLKEVAGGKSTAALKQKETAPPQQELAPPIDIEGGKIVEGKFDGQNMMGSDNRSYPVPANYASKSKLVPGDVLKLTITDAGNFIYKQIGPVPRKNLIGTLAYEDGQYKVIAQGQAFKVLLASVTYFKAEVGDQVAIIVPEFEDCEWSAIENVIPSEQLQQEMETKVTYNVKKEEADPEDDNDTEEETEETEEK